MFVSCRYRVPPRCPKGRQERPKDVKTGAQELPRATQKPKSCHEYGTNGTNPDWCQCGPRLRLFLVDDPRRPKRWPKGRQERHERSPRAARSMAPMTPIQIGAIWVYHFVCFLQAQVAQGPPRTTQGYQNCGPRAAKRDTREALEPPGIWHQWHQSRLVPCGSTTSLVSC